MKLRSHILSPSLARGLAVLCVAVFVTSAPTVVRAADVFGAALNNTSQDGDGRWAVVISNIGVLRQWLVDHGYRVRAYTDEQIATALLGASPPGGPYMWLSTAHMDETFKYLRKHGDS